MADIRLIFNKSYAKKQKINNDEEASKLLPPKTDTDELQELSSSCNIQKDTRIW